MELQQTLVITDILVFTTVATIQNFRGRNFGRTVHTKNVIIFWKMLKLAKAPKIIIMHLLFTGQLKL